MKLDRNINGDGRGKYAILKLRELDRFRQPTTFGEIDPEIAMALAVLERAGILDWGTAGTEAEFMLIRLKDKYADAALWGYAAAARDDDPEYAAEIEDMARRAGSKSPWCKRPD